jgi:hypothetical protein
MRGERLKSIYIYIYIHTYIYIICCIRVPGFVKPSGPVPVTQNLNMFCEIVSLRKTK